jgi:hypothetical protein
MPPRSLLAYQFDLRAPSFPELQPAACAEDTLDQDAAPCSGIPISENTASLDEGVYNPINFICPEARALLGCC